MPYKWKKDDYDPDQTFQIPPIGDVKVRITEDTKERLSSSGNEMMEIVCEVIEGPGKGSKLWDYVVFNDYAPDRFGKIMDSCGIPTNADRMISPAVLIGKVGIVHVRHEVFEGQKRAKVAWWVRPRDAQTSHVPHDADEPPIENYHPPASSGDEDLPDWVRK